MSGFLDIINQIGVTAILIFFITLFTFYYILSTWDRNYWSNKGVPGDTPWPLVGTFYPSLMNSRLEEIDLQRHKKYGRIHGGIEGGMKILFVTDPELIKQVMIKDFPSFTNRREMKVFNKHPVLSKSITILRGEEWKSTRAAVSPTFTTGKIKQMVHLVEDSTKKLIEHLDKFAESKQPMDFKRCFSAFTLDVIATCAFGMKIDFLEDENNEFLKKAMNNFNAPPIILYLLIAFPNLFSSIGRIVEWKTGNPLQYFIKIASDMIEMRKKEKLRPQKDFLDLLLEAEQEENQSRQTESGTAIPNKKKVLTHNGMIAQSIIFLLAGHETTATTLSFIAYSLAQNSNIQEKLIQEIDDVMIECKGKLSYDAVMGMKYMEMVVSETLRFYPPGSRVERACGVDNYKLGNVMLQKEDVVTVSVYALHKDPEFFPNPDIFDPERFNSENTEARQPCTYLPFGLGPRNCIAKRFALIEVKLVLAYVLSNYRFLTCDKTEVPLQIKPSGGLIAPKSVTLLIEKRSDKPQLEN